MQRLLCKKVEEKEKDVVKKLKEKGVVKKLKEKDVVKKLKEKDVEIKKLKDAEKKVESNYMNKRRFNHNDKLWIAKEEVKDLERLLKEAEERLNQVYDKMGGRTWFVWVWYVLGYKYD